MRIEFAKRAILGLTLYAFALQVQGAQALVTVAYSTDAGPEPLDVGEQFGVDVTASFDGSSFLGGVFTSTRWDPRQITLVSATDAPFTLFGGVETPLIRLSNPVRFPTNGPPTDPVGTLRTVQFGTPGPSPATEPGSALVTRLTFEVIGGGDGAALIEGILLLGDTVYDVASAAPPFGGTSSSDLDLGSVTVALVPGQLGRRRPARRRSFRRRHPRRPR